MEKHSSRKLLQFCSRIGFETRVYLNWPDSDNNFKEFAKTVF